MGLWILLSVSIHHRPAELFFVLQPWQCQPGRRANGSLWLESMCTCTLIILPSSSASGSSLLMSGLFSNLEPQQPGSSTEEKQQLAHLWVRGAAFGRPSQMAGDLGSWAGQRCGSRKLKSCARTAKAISLS